MKRVAIIGAGPAGCVAAIRLSRLGHKVTLIERESSVGGNLNNWYKMFPDGKRASELVSELSSKLQNSNVEVLTDTLPEKIDKTGSEFVITLSDKALITANAILVSTGFRTFNAKRKEEYGYGIYQNVMTSVELENLFTNNFVGEESIARVGLVHCVGSRDEKCGNMHCSKVCCITAVKQAIEVKQKFPNAEIFCFYMDMRMFGPGYEELYREAQEKYGIKFVRGRLSEAGETADSKVFVKVEDTLVGKPMRMTLDKLVLMVGMEPSEGTTQIANLLKLNKLYNGFIKQTDPHIGTNLTNIDGVFVAGTATSPMNSTDTITDARSAAMVIDEYLKRD